MVAIAAVVASKPASSFVYFTKPIPRWLRKNPVGNFARALALGAEVISCFWNRVVGRVFTSPAFLCPPRVEV